MKTTNGIANGTLDAQLNRIDKIMLWLNSGCNARCGTCDIWKEKIGEYLTIDTIRELAPQWKSLGVSTVVVCGEPLLHPDLWSILPIIRQQGIRVELLTNGFLLARQVDQVVENCSVLRVSLDGPEVIHNRMRGHPRAYELLKKGIYELRQISPDYQVSGRCAVHIHNYKYLPETVNAAKELGLTGISFSGTDVYNPEAFKRNESIGKNYVESFVISHEMLSNLELELNRLLQSHKDEFETNFITDSYEQLRYLLIEYYGELAGGACRSLVCNAPWTSVVLEYDGTLRPCFPMPAFANIYDFDSMKDALNSLQAQTFRKNLTIQGNATCHKCVDQSVN